MKDVTTYSDAEILHAAHQLREGYKMKRILRYKTKRDMTVHNESDAEHVFALIYIAQYFLRTEPSGPSLNAEKLYSILLFHDFGEIKYGDIVSYEKTGADEEREQHAAKEVFASLPEPLAEVGYGYWQDYEQQKSPEAHFAYALDKIEPLFELFDPITERSIKRLNVSYDMHVGNKFPYVKDFPVMRRFVEVMSEDMRARGVFV